MPRCAGAVPTDSPGLLHREIAPRLDLENSRAHWLRRRWPARRAAQVLFVLDRGIAGRHHFVAVLTHRDPDSRNRTEAAHELHFARSLDDKGRLCRELDIDVYFDDQDECVVGVDERTTVFKVRNGGNFDFELRKWLSTDRLTTLL
jgi:hypothetical protein